MSRSRSRALSSRFALTTAIGLSACTGSIGPSRGPGDTPGPPDYPGAPGVPSTPGMPGSPMGGGTLGTMPGTPGTSGSPTSGGTPGTLGTPATLMGEASLHRLTTDQYKAALEDLFGASNVAKVPIDIEPNVRLSGLVAIGSSRVALSQRGTEQNETVITRMVATVFDDPTKRPPFVGCDAAQPTCANDFVTRFGRRAWRRPLDADEVKRYVALAQLGATKLADPWAGLRYAAMALLQSPHFLYRVEIGQSDPTNQGRRVLGPYEVASRLAFFLTNRGPDDVLLGAAGAGQLKTPKDVLAQAQRLMTSPRVPTALETFFEDYLGLNNFSEVVKTSTTFTPALRDGMLQETKRTLRVLTFDEGQDYRSVLNTKVAFVTPDLAKLYGMPAPLGTGLVRTTQPAGSPRAGILAQGSLLALSSHPGATSPTLRGKFIRETLLCVGIPDPPGNVNTDLPEQAAKTKTTRQRLEAHAQNPQCAGCHALMDPLGLALENFDTIGRFRDVENGLPIDASGEIDGTKFSGPVGLADAVAGHANLPGCFATAMLRHAAGSALDTSVEMPLTAEIEKQFKDDQFAVKSLMLRIAGHPVFAYVKALD